MKLADVLDVLNALEREGVRYAVFGGVAMAIHGFDRATCDLDVFLPADADNVARLRRALHSVFNDPNIEDMTAEDLAGDYPVIQYGPPGVDFTIDLISRIGPDVTFSDLEVQRIRLDDTEVAVVTLPTLHRMKRDSDRLQDNADAARIMTLFGAVA